VVGKTLTHYEILAPLGAGGMGEVYRARDTKLERDVAIKVLPDDLAADPDRLARFEREAKLLAALNHANIGTIHGLEDDNGVHFLVLELIDGETLERRLHKGAIPVPEALDVARQIAEALEAAHDAGIIHRDVKPANVLLTVTGGVKVLDFGIAKSTTVEANAALTERATSLTMDGSLMGTPPYMAPEQIRGEEADKRADIWAFGCVVYEMLTGKGAFGRETVADTLVAVLEQEPDWSLLPSATPGEVRSLLHRCLQKNPRLRLRDMGDAWVEINALLTDPTKALIGLASTSGTVERAPPVATRRSAAAWIAVAMVGGAALGALGVWSFTGPTGSAGLSGIREVEIGLPAGRALSGPAVLSPDGRDLVYVGTQSGERWLYHRPMGEREATPLEGTEGAFDPFFSADGVWVGFFAGADIKRVELSGGQPITVCGGCVTNANGAAWLANDTIVFGDQRDLYQVPAAGGEPASFGQRDPDAGVRYSRPAALPGSSAVLIQLDDIDPGSSAGIAVATILPDAAAVPIDAGIGASPHYSPTGHVVFSREGALFAVPFDLQLRQATGPAVRVLDGARPEFRLSRDGTLAYVAGTALSDVLVNEVVSVDLQGNVSPLIDIAAPGYGPKQYWDVRLSPDQQRLALSAQEPGGSQQIWVYDIARRTMDPITSEGVSRYPVWSHDGARIAFSTSLVAQGIVWRAVAGLSGAQEQLTTFPSRPGSFSPDGTVLAFRGSSGGEGLDRDIMLRPMEGDPTPIPFVATDASESTPRFSPDGHWLTYTSDKTGGPEVYVTSFPQEHSNRVSTAGGWSAVWDLDGRSIYYRSGDRMMRVSFEPGPEPALGEPELLFEGRYEGATTRAQYDVAPAGTGFVMLTVRRPMDAAEGGRSSPDRINIVFNWFETLKDRVPPER